MKTDKCKGQLTAGQFNLYKTWSGNLFGLRREEQDHEAHGEIVLGNRTERRGVFISRKKVASLLRWMTPE